MTQFKRSNVDFYVELTLNYQFIFLGVPRQNVHLR